MFGQVQISGSLKQLQSAVDKALLMWAKHRDQVPSRAASQVIVVLDLVPTCKFNGKPLSTFFFAFYFATFVSPRIHFAKKRKRKVSFRLRFFLSRLRV